MRWFALALAAFAASSCASAYQMKLPSQGGHWLELRSDHFLLDTDLGEPDARQFIEEMEDRRTALITAAWHGAVVPNFKTRVVAFRNADELEQFAPRGLFGFLRQDLIGEKWMVMAVAPGKIYGDLFDGIEVVTRQMVQDLESFYFATRPAWMMEGLANFLETMVLDHKNGTVVIGSLDELVRLPAERLASLGSMLAGESLDLNLADWLVFYLINHEGEAFNKYQRALIRGDEAAAAWADAFPEYVGEKGIARLSERLGSYSSQSRITYRTETNNFLEYAGEEALRTMSEAEVLAMRGAIYSFAPRGLRSDTSARAEAEADADAALALDPTLPMALQLRVQLTVSRETKLQLARAASAARPEEASAWLLLDEAMGDSGTASEEAERISALQKAIELGPESAWTLQRLARALVRDGRAGEAVELIRRSLFLYPDSTEALDTAAAVAAAQGKCEGALQLEKMAVERLPHPFQAASSEPEAAYQFASPTERLFRAHLQRYADGCKPAGPH